MTVPPYSKSTLLLMLLLTSSTTVGVKAFGLTSSNTRKRSIPWNAMGFRHAQGRDIIASPVVVHMSATASTDAQPGQTETQAPGFIETALRSAAMKLHTKEQAPREGQAESKPRAEPYVPTIEDYLRFLVDSKHVYEAFEEAVQCEKYPELAVLWNTGLERTVPLESDIQQLVKEFDLVRPPVGQKGMEYANEIREMIVGGKGTVPEFICHYYNFYFAHTAGGRMIGKQMSALLLNNKTLEFYKVRRL